MTVVHLVKNFRAFCGIQQKCLHDCDRNILLDTLPITDIWCLQELVFHCSNADIKARGTGEWRKEERNDHIDKESELIFLCLSQSEKLQNFKTSSITWVWVWVSYEGRDWVCSYLYDLAICGSSVPHGINILQIFLYVTSRHVTSHSTDITVTLWILLLLLLCLNVVLIQKQVKIHGEESLHCGQTDNGWNLVHSYVI